MSDMDTYLHQIDNIVEAYELTGQKSPERSAYTRLSELLSEYVAGESLDCVAKLNLLTNALGAYVRLRTVDAAVASIEADSLAQLLFIECARCILGIEFHQLPDTDEFKSAFRTSIERVPGCLNGHVISQRFLALSALSYHQWNHPMLMAMMKGEDINEQNALTYVTSVEFPDIMRLRVEMLVDNGCNSLALNLVRWCLQSPVFQADSLMCSFQLVLLHRLGHLDDFNAQCRQLACCTALQLSELIRQSWSKQDRDALRLFCETVTLFHWTTSGDCCARRLLEVWLEVERPSDQSVVVESVHDGVVLDSDTRIPQIIDTVMAVSRSAQQLVTLVDVIVSMFNDRYISRCSQLAINALTPDDGLPASRLEAIAVTVCECVARLYAGWPQMHLACLMSAFYVSPTDKHCCDLMTYFRSLQQSIPPSSPPIPPPTVDVVVYSALLFAIDRLRPTNFLHPAPTSTVELETAVVMHLAQRRSAAVTAPGGIGTAQGQLVMSNMIQTGIIGPNGQIVAVLPSLTQQQHRQVVVERTIDGSKQDGATTQQIPTRYFVNYVGGVGHLSEVVESRPAAVPAPVPAPVPTHHHSEDSHQQHHNNVDMNSALHSTLDDIQQILTAGQLNGNIAAGDEMSTFDERALGEITAFLQSEQGAWNNRELLADDAIRNFSSVGFPPASVALPADRKSNELPPKKNIVTAQVVRTVVYRCVECLATFDAPPPAGATSAHRRGNVVCNGAVTELSGYRCSRCGISYGSHSAAQHHVLFLCTCDETGHDLAKVMRKYSCSACDAAFFSMAGLHMHAASCHGGLVATGGSGVPHSSALHMTSEVVRLNEQFTAIKSLSSNAVSLQSSEWISNHGDQTVLIHDESLEGSPSVGQIAAGGTANAAKKPAKQATRRRFSGRPPKGIIYKNVFMTSEGMYYCSTCNADLSTIESRAAHRGQPCGRASAASYSRRYAFICPHCGARAASQKACYEHQIAVCLPHAGVSMAELVQRRYSCPLCARPHFSLAPLRGHMVTAHRLDRADVVRRLIEAGYISADENAVKDDARKFQTKGPRLNVTSLSKPEESHVLTELSPLTIISKPPNIHALSDTDQSPVVEDVIANVDVGFFDADNPFDDGNNCSEMIGNFGGNIGSDASESPTADEAGDESICINSTGVDVGEVVVCSANDEMQDHSTVSVSDFADESRSRLEPIHSSDNSVEMMELGGSCGGSVVTLSTTVIPVIAGSGSHFPDVSVANAAGAASVSMTTSMTLASNKVMPLISLRPFGKTPPLATVRLPAAFDGTGLLLRGAGGGALPVYRARVVLPRPAFNGHHNTFIVPARRPSDSDSQAARNAGSILTDNLVGNTDTADTPVVNEPPQDQKDAVETSKSSTDSDNSVSLEMCTQQLETSEMDCGKVEEVSSNEVPASVETGRESWSDSGVHEDMDSVSEPDIVTKSENPVHSSEDPDSVSNAVDNSQKSSAASVEDSCFDCGDVKPAEFEINPPAVGNSVCLQNGDQSGHASAISPTLQHQTCSLKSSGVKIATSGRLRLRSRGLRPVSSVELSNNARAASSEEQKSSAENGNTGSKHDNNSSEHGNTGSKKHRRSKFVRRVLKISMASSGDGSAARHDRQLPSRRLRNTVGNTEMPKTVSSKWPAHGFSHADKNTESHHPIKTKLAAGQHLTSVRTRSRDCQAVANGKVAR